MAPFFSRVMPLIKKSSAIVGKQLLKKAGKFLDDYEIKNKNKALQQDLEDMEGSGIGGYKLNKRFKTTSCVSNLGRATKTKKLTKKKVNKKKKVTKKKKKDIKKVTKKKKKDTKSSKKLKIKKIKEILNLARIPKQSFARDYFKTN